MYAYGRAINLDGSLCRYSRFEYNVWKECYDVNTYQRVDPAQILADKGTDRAFVKLIEAERTKFVARTGKRLFLEGGERATIYPMNADTFPNQHAAIWAAMFSEVDADWAPVQKADLYPYPQV